MLPVMLRRLIAALTTLCVVGVTLAAASSETACRKCTTADDLPIINCTALPPHSDGCRGLPREDAGVDSVVYPLACQVRVDDPQSTQECRGLDCYCSTPYVDSGVSGQSLIWICPP
jgi:hypothetical protein